MTPKLDQLPCAPDSPSAPAPEPTGLQLVPLSSRMRDACQELVDHIHGSLQAITRRVDAAKEEVRARITGRLERVQDRIQLVQGFIADRNMTAVQQVLMRMAPHIDLSQLEREVSRTAASLPGPAVGTPPPPMPGQIFQPRPAPRVTYATGYDVPFGIPAMGEPPGWLTVLPERYALPALPGGQPEYVPFGTPEPPPVALGSAPVTPASPASAAPPRSAPTRPTRTRAATRPTPAYTVTAGMEAPGAPGTAAGRQDASPAVPGDVSPLSVYPEGGGEVFTLSGFPTGGTSAADAGAGAADTAGAGTGADDVTERAACPPVHVHVHCAPGASAAVGDAPDQFQFVSDTADPERVLGEGGEFPLPMPFEAAGKDRSAPTASERRKAADAENLATAVKNLTPLLGAGPAAAVLKMLDTAGTLEGCQEAGRAKQPLDDAVKAFNKWLTGSDDGTKIQDGGLLHYLGYGAHQNTTLGRVLGEILIPIWLALRQSLAVGFTLGGCDEPAFVFVQLVRGLFGALEKWTGVAFPEAQAKIEYVAGELCAARIPTTGEAHTAYLADIIDAQTWSCWVRANGDRDDMASIPRDSLRTIPSPLQITNVWQRTSLDPNDLRDMLRQSGVLEQRHVDWFRELAAYVPAPGDIVSFMVRDVFDQRVVDKYGYDADLEQKFQGQALYWARAQGMTIEQFQYYWRAHWRLPSPTQGYAMAHRLRPGRVPKGVETTIPEIDELLAVNDYPEFWRERLIALSYHPLTRVDLRRAYFIGAVNEQETFDGILDLGYNERDAKVLLRYWQQERVNWAANQPWAKSYVRDELSDDELVERLGRLQLTGLQQDQLEQELDLRSEALHKKNVIANIKRRVLSGITGESQAYAELVSLGYRHARATKIAARWEAERESRGKVLTAAQLCTSFSLGLMSGDQYTEALLRLGYNLTDVRRLISICESSKKLEPSGFGAPGVDGIAQAAEGDRQAQLRQLRQQNMEIARTARARKGVGLAEERVLKKLTTVANALAKGLGGKAADYSPALTAMHKSLTDGACYTRQGAADLIHAVVMDLAKRRVEDWQTVAGEYFDSLPPRPCPAADRPAEPQREELAEPETK